jgi:hypothetical protein
VDRAVPDRARHPRRTRGDGHGLTALAWKRVDTVGLERFEVRRSAEVWTLRGSILLVHERAAFEARYELACDHAWVTRTVAVDLRGPEGDRSLRLTAKEGRWHIDGVEREAIRGCVDVDLGWSPSTNTLPIRRLDLSIGDTRAVTAAWVRFPELTVEPLPQEYRRLAERRYRYSSAGGRSVAELEVDDEGLVKTYGQIWARV